MGNIAGTIDTLKRYLPKSKPSPKFHSFQPIVVENDEEEETAIPSPLAERENARGTTFGIKYFDAKGNVSVRRVSCQSFDGSHLYAYCHERKRARCFRLDRIREIYDMHTGEIWDDASEFLGVLSDFGIRRKSDKPAPGKNQEKAMSRIRDGVRVLVYIARSDGFVHPKEMEVVEDYCRQRCSGGNTQARDYSMPVEDYNMKAIMDWAARQFPDIETVESSLYKVAGSTSNWELLRKSIRAIVDADGVLHPDEVQAVMEIERIMEEAA